MEKKLGPNPFLRIEWTCNCLLFHEPSYTIELSWLSGDCGQITDEESDLAINITRSGNTKLHTYYPWHVALTDGGASVPMACAGTLVGTKWVLTAAQCQKM